MAVVKAPVRQQSYLTEYDRQMAEYLRRMGGSIGAQDIASEAYGGKFPVGTMTAKILSGVLARASDKRAMNREERAKDSYSRAFEIAKAMERGLNAMPGELGVDQSGNLDLLPTTALQTTDGVTNRQPYVFKDDSLNDRTYEVATNMGNYDANGNITYADDPMINQNIDRARIANQRAEAFANASPEAPLGAPYARQDVALTVGEPTGEDTTRIGRYLSGTLEQDVLPTNANKALSQALRGANVPEFQFDEYRQNKRIQDRNKKLAEMPQRKMIEVFDKQNNRIQITAIFNPLNGQTTYEDKLNNPVDISQYTFTKYDLAGDDYQIIDADGTVSIENLTKSEVANYKNAGKSVTEFYPNQTFDAIANNIKERNITENLGYDIQGNLINKDNGKIILEYFEGNRATQSNKSKQSIDTRIDKTIISDEDETVEVTEIKPFVITEEMQTEIDNYNTSEPILKLENQLLQKANQLSNTTVGSSIYKTLSKEKEDLENKIETKKTNLATTKKDYQTDVNYLSTFSNDVYMYERDINQIKGLLKTIEGGQRLDDTKLAMLMKGKAWIPGSPASQIEELLKSLGGRISFEALATMRKNSKTGGAVGQLSEGEREVLGMTQGVIKFEQIRTTLNSLDDLLKRLKKDKARFINNHNDMFNTKFEENF